jgi:putative transposase
MGIPDHVTQKSKSGPETCNLTRVLQIRCEAYRALVNESLDGDQLDAIRAHLQRQHALGSDRFRIAIETLLDRHAGPAKIGRTKKSKADLESAT